MFILVHFTIENWKIMENKYKNDPRTKKYMKERVSITEICTSMETTPDQTNIALRKYCRKKAKLNGKSQRFCTRGNKGTIITKIKAKS